MSSKLSQPWIPLERVESAVQIELGFVILGLALGAWAFYKLFLKKVSLERHKNLRNQFLNLGLHVLAGIVLFLFYWGLNQVIETSPTAERIIPYIGLFTLLSWARVFVKTSRILVLEYLFIWHMNVGVPKLFVNLFSLLLSIFVAGGILVEIFNINLTPLLATSAIFSLVLGLAVQDTLGNLFAGIALQFDKPFTLGDWIEIQNSGQKWIGKVHEISWRATILIAPGDEIVVVPNRTVSQAQVSNYTAKHHPIIRSQIFRIPFGASPETVRSVLQQAALTVPSITKNPAPFVIIWETTESWVAFKLVYYIKDFGSQYLIADQIITAVLKHLEYANIPLATSRLELTNKRRAPHAT